jgi:hypothetical protein
MVCLQAQEGPRALLRRRQSPSGPVDPSFRALSVRVKFTVRRPKFNANFLSCAVWYMR